MSITFFGKEILNIMELLKIENGYIQCQEFSKVKLSTIKKVTYEKMERCQALKIGQLILRKEIRFVV